MSRHKLRENKECLNCGYLVRKRYCPKCGQENVETRQSFHYLFTHFIEDLVHYDGSFWKTVKNLLLKPGVLTKEYLEGRRKKYVAPVKLYIFVSFFVFVIGGILSSIINSAPANNNTEGIPIEFTISKPEKSSDTPNQNDENQKNWFVDKDNIENSTISIFSQQYKIPNFIIQKAVDIQNKYTATEFSQKLGESMKSNFSKFLFFYMPVFAFFMWFFHHKKRWYFFEHGIFTLHYFSFILLFLFLSILIVDPILGLITPNDSIYTFLSFLNGFLTLGWVFIYFFKAHKKVYGHSWLSTILKGWILFFTNIIFFFFGVALYLFIILFLL